MSVEDDMNLKNVAASHEELCDGALEHYNEISTQAMHSSSLIPKAIEYYRRWVPIGERKIVYTPGKLLEALEAGWVFDPWLNSRGGPIVAGGPITVTSVTETASEIYWVLVRGTPEQIAGLEPFVELPSEEEEPMPESALIPYGIRTEYIAYNDDGEPSREPGKGFVIMHKDHIYKAGTVYTLPPAEDAMQKSSLE